MGGRDYTPERATVFKSWKPFAGIGPGRRGHCAAGEGGATWGKQCRLSPETWDGVSADEPAAGGAARIGKSRTARTGECSNSLPISKVLQASTPDEQGQNRVSAHRGTAEPGGKNAAIEPSRTVTGRPGGQSFRLVSLWL